VLSGDTQIESRDGSGFSGNLQKIIGICIAVENHTATTKSISLFVSRLHRTCATVRIIFVNITLKSQSRSSRNK